ncbi:hypothetical protein ACFO6R_06065 [Eubacterium multiforme]|uniref:Uncharacterized protein n=1 Tax=Eubacterium multiforme TaxID=83339 RepID=A0ABT9US58_9FIRM|nr:hypothetical protein [Eubacterium multiforme]MDQ0149151.1 hypothetical protein [Eubacterium multiforme]
MSKEMEVELNFPKDMKIIERKMAEVLADIVVKRYGPEKSAQIAKELKKRLEEKELKDKAL